MISRPLTCNSIVKLDFCGPFCTRFLRLPALRGPQIVKLELGGHKIALMPVPALRGHQIVKLEMVPQVGFAQTFLTGVFDASRGKGAANRKVGIGWS